PYRLFQIAVLVVRIRCFSACRVCDFLKAMIRIIRVLHFLFVRIDESFQISGLVIFVADLIPVLIRISLDTV
ncbi:hypothetical protein P4H28_03930, partial [Paenibacillus larvae]|uniref:hypothetical protein n=1 Tax=Paenibacillus larvae TaxID=1464 RepID=UPI00227E38EC